MSPEQKDKPKRAKTPAYTQFTLKALRELGYEAGVVEKWIQWGQGDARIKGKGRPGFKQDLFSFLDIIALCDEKGILGVQSTSEKCRLEHKQKILAEPKAKRWLKSGGKIALCTWKKVKKPKKDGTVGKATGWKARWDMIELKDFAASDS